MAEQITPALTVLSLGAGVQSTALLLLSAEGVLPKLDAAIFSDTGWEPQAVYDHLNRLEEEVAKPAGIPIYRVTAGNIRNDALDPDHRFASMPLFVKNPDGSKGMARRQCTHEYKVRPIKEQLRLLLGAERDSEGKVGRVKVGQYVDQWIGISVDEFHRAKDSSVKYIKHSFPLLDLEWTRDHCLVYLKKRGWESTPKSACIGCPFRNNHGWRQLRDHYPSEFADAVAFDNDIRDKGQLWGEAFLHPSCLPLEQAPIDKQSRKEKQQAEKSIDLFLEGEVEFTCSPFSCRADEMDLEDFIIEEE